MKKAVCFAGLLALLALPGVALSALTDAVASITFIDKQADAKRPQEAPVSVLRDATRLADRDIDIGTALQNYDVVKTGANSTVEITFYPQTGMTAVLRLKPNTTLGIDVSALRSEQKGVVNLMGGAIELKVKKLVGANQLSVRTQSAAMGVRGTQFEVGYSPSGDVLLTTREGRVECAVDDGKVLYSAPGDVVQGTFDGSWSSVPVAVDKLDAFKAAWNAQRLAAFKANPIRATRQFALLYLRQKNRFDAAYAELMGKRDLIQKWIREDAAGNVGTSAERNREKTQLIAGLMKLRRVNFMFERVYYRLLQLDELYGQGLIPEARIAPGVKTGDFFRRFRDERSALAARFADIQYVTKLYAKRNDGAFPLDDAAADSLLGEGQAFDAGPDFGDAPADDGE